MTNTDELLEKIKNGCCDIFGDLLTGIYLHGSIVMGCFNYEKSDVDIIIVVKDAITDAHKRLFMEMIVSMNKKAPPKGIEISIIREDVCRPFVYPTPYELHFSSSHLSEYISDPETYIQRMTGTDKDLAAHLKILYNRGKTIYGRKIADVFEDIPDKYYRDSIIYDIADAKDDILKDTMYITLNLCRVLAYVTEGLILSKQEGGMWALGHIGEESYALLIRQALGEYASCERITADDSVKDRFAEYMLGKISNK